MLSLLGAPALRAEDLQVNSLTAYHGDPVVAMSSAGDFVVVWHSRIADSDDVRAYDVRARLYDRNGRPRGVEFQVNSYTTDSQYLPAVAMRSDGDFIVVWESFGSSETDTGGFSVQAQLYQSSGLPFGSQFQVNSNVIGFQRYPAVAMTSAGDFVVAWWSLRSIPGTTATETSIQARLYSSSDASLGDEFQVNSDTMAAQFSPAVAMSDAGDFVVVWESAGSSGTDTSGRSIQAQRFDSSAVPIGGQFQVNSYTTNDQAVPAVAMDGDGNFAVVWYRRLPFTIHGQLYDSSGTPIGDEIQVSQTTSLQLFPAVAMSNSGNFLVVWDSLGSEGTDTSRWSIQGRRYDSSGMPLSDQFQVNSYTTGFQVAAAVAMSSDSTFAVVWETRPSAALSSAARIHAFTSRIFADGFESGDTSVW